MRETTQQEDLLRGIWRENPVLIRLNDRAVFLDAFRSENRPRPLPETEPEPQNITAMELAEDESGFDDDMPL